MKCILMRLLLVCALNSVCFCSAYAIKEDQFEQFGDVFRYLPIYTMIVSVAFEDYEGVGQLLLGSLSTQLVTEGIKASLDSFSSHKYPIKWAKRPCCDIYKGMPSGHSAGAFSAAGYVYYRYGIKSAVPVGILAILTAASRVEAQKHSLLQVSVGAAIAWGFAWLFTKEYQPKNTLVLPNIERDIQGNTLVSLYITHRF